LVCRLSRQRLRCTDLSSGMRQFGHLSSTLGVIRDTCNREPQNIEACLASQRFFFIKAELRESQFISSNCSPVHFNSLV
jgi:hypothetical protein